MEALSQLLLGLGSGFAGAAFLMWLMTRHDPALRSLDRD